MVYEKIEKIAVTTYEDGMINRAKVIAKQLQLNFIQTDYLQYPYLFVVESDRLSIHYPQDKRIKPLFIDFNYGTFGYRWQHAQGRNELIAKAVGIKKSYRPSVIDTTAGLGRDGFLLSKLGCSVTMLERSPIFFLLLENGLDRFRREQSDITKKIAKEIRKDITKEITKEIKVELIYAEAREFLSKLDTCDYPDVIYLDPMFPERNKSALVKKEMRALQDLVGDDLDSDQLFKIAQKKSKKRVVVKRPLYAPPISNKKPDLVYRSKSIRFDLYFHQ